ncbi:hypothetical protein D083_0399 [Dickeya solani RNS 08.23.3.1.A]|nr:hypothetical protein D083_0399 [Dickeya solani RNS 08.23.3.1.A]
MTDFFIFYDWLIINLRFPYLWRHLFQSMNAMLFFFLVPYANYVRFLFIRANDK